jgi:hypothetical protein
MKKLLENNFMEERSEVVKTLFKFDFLLEKRIDYIVEEICKVCNLPTMLWYYPVEIDDKVFSDNSNITLEYMMTGRMLHDKLIIILNDGSECELHKFPQRWLSENFEKELKDGWDSYCELSSKKKKDLAAALKEKEAVLLAKIKSKLNIEELEFLSKVLKNGK